MLIRRRHRHLSWQSQIIFTCLAMAASFLPITNIHFALVSPCSAGFIGLEDVTVDHYFDQAMEAIKDKEYAWAESQLRLLLENDSTYQEGSGRSAWYWLGYVLEQQDRIEDAILAMEDGLISLNDASMPDYYLQYHLARLYAESLKPKSNTKITSLVYSVFNDISGERQPDLWELLWDQGRTLLNDQEQKSAGRMVDDPQGKPGTLLLGAFRRNDPTPSTFANEFLAGFFRRAREARELFPHSGSPSGYDERGDYFVRLGPPEKVLYDRSGTRSSVGYAIYPYEFWFYFNIHPDLYITFVGQTGKVDFVEMPGPESIFGTFYRGQRTFFNRQQPGGMVVSNLRRDVYLELAPVHEIFRDRLYRLDQRFNDKERQEYARHQFPAEDRIIATQRKEVLEQLYLGSDFNLEGLPVWLTWSQFQAEDGRVRVEFYYGIPLKELYFDFNYKGYFTEIRSQIGLLSEDHQFVAGDSLAERIQLASMGDTDAGAFVGQWSFDLEPGLYHALFRLDNPNGEKQQVFRTDVRAEPFPKKTLSISDIQLASEIHVEETQNRFTKNGHFVKPIAGNTVQTDLPVFAYYEIYNLMPGAGGETKYSIEYQLYRSADKTNILNLPAERMKKLRVYQNRITRAAMSTNEIEYQKLDFGDIKAGKYLLSIMVSDLNAGKNAIVGSQIQLN